MRRQWTMVAVAMAAALWVAGCGGSDKAVAQPDPGEGGDGDGESTGNTEAPEEQLEEIVATARSTGFDHVSFLPLDATSSAFGARPGERHALIPSATQLTALEDAIGRLPRGDGGDRGRAFTSSGGAQVCRHRANGLARGCRVVGIRGQRSAIGR